MSGGGGWGSPLEREPEAVLSDVLNGFVSVDGARDLYGVVIEDPKGGTINKPETERLREELKHTGPRIRLGGQLKVLLTVSLDLGNVPGNLVDNEKEVGVKGVIESMKLPSGKIVFKVEGSSYEEALSRVREIERVAGVVNSKLLTVQFVPSDFSLPKS